MYPEHLIYQAKELLQKCRQSGVFFTTAESCTGGLVAGLITEIAGSSDVFERGFVTYSNLSKTQMLGVDADLIAQQGAVSEQVAAAMAKGAIQKSKATLALAITGIAGPGGGTDAKPVGLVYIATALADTIVAKHFIFSGSRHDVRMQAVTAGINMLHESLGSGGNIMSA